MLKNHTVHPDFLLTNIAQSAEAVEYTECFSPEG